MGGTNRDIAERKKALAEIEKTVHVQPREIAMSAGTPTLSTRTQAQIAADAAAPEVLAPPSDNRRTCATTGVSMPTSSTRERQNLIDNRTKDALAEKKNDPNAAAQASADYWLALHNQREAEEKAKRDADIASGKLKIL